MSEIRNIRAEIDAKLHVFFERKLEGMGPEMAPVLPLIHLVQEFTLRTAKRIRPLMVYAGFVAADADSDSSQVLDAALAMELLQSYLLIQDDWMDADILRRGQPSVHHALKNQYDEHLANTVAILASDLASAYAEELIITANLNQDAVCAAMAVYSRMHQDVIFGQYLDVTGQGDVDLVHRLKTAAYTVRGPLLIGAELAQASDEQKSLLTTIGEQLGLAFQLRDDLLGTFGSSKKTGKAADNDLQSGKRTALIKELLLRLDDNEGAKVQALLDRGTLSDEELAELRQNIEDSGARQAVEERVNTLSTGALEALEASTLTEKGVRFLRAIVDLLIQRQS